MPYANYTEQEVELRGEALYVEHIRDKVHPQHQGKFLVIDIETGEYEIDADDLAARNSCLPIIPTQSFTACASGIRPLTASAAAGKCVMMTGRVTANREAVIELEVVGSNQTKGKVEAVMDTGFNGYLILPSDLVNRFKLQLAGNRRATLGDGNTVVLDGYLANVVWHDQEREILVLQAEGGPLIGMSLLYGNRVTAAIVDGGDVRIEPLSSGLT